MYWWLAAGAGACPGLEAQTKPPGEENLLRTGNAGIGSIAGCVNIDALDFAGLAAFAAEMT